MVIRFNNLKIFILANEAKPGGLIGSMLSPYLYSVNMNDFCKKFNELTKDYLAGIWLCVNIFSDVLDRSYYFLIKNLSVNLLINGIFDNYGKLYLIILYDVILFFKNLYKIEVYRSCLILFSFLNNFNSFIFNKIDLQFIFLKKINYSFKLIG